MGAAPLRGVKTARSLLALALALAAGCAPDAADAETTGSVAQAITGGQDAEGDPAVVALLHEGEVACTGVLVAPAVVVTAAHCLSREHAPDEVFFGKDPAHREGGVVVGVAATKAHPAFDPRRLTHDIGVVGLAANASVDPVPYLDAAFDPSFKDRALRIVGFGAPSADTIGRHHKREGRTSIDSFEAATFRFRPSPAGACTGDSGGPAFASIDGREVLVGLTSWGDADCRRFGNDTRVDAYVSFLTDYAASYTPPQAPPPQAGGCSMGAPTEDDDRRIATIGYGSLLVAISARRRARERARAPRLARP